MKKLTFLTGARISQESGIETYRDTNGLWYNHDIKKVATYEGWLQDPRYVLEFYNEMRDKLKTVEPNIAHYKLAELEKNYDVTVLTQNVDDLHERGDSTDVIHLHGELTKARGSGRYDNIMDIGYDRIEFGQTDDEGNQIRPHVVWFGEPVLNMTRGMEIVSQSDILIVKSYL
jgi:NAD-dependent deacetylase